MVQFLPLDVTSEESVGLILSHIDNSIQYGEAEVSSLLRREADPGLVLIDISSKGTERTEGPRPRRF